MTRSSSLQVCHYSHHVRCRHNQFYHLTGRAEDVQIAADEIREAAEHFTIIRAQRSRIGALQSPLAPNEGEPGTVTVKVIMFI